MLALSCLYLTGDNPLFPSGAESNREAKETIELFYRGFQGDDQVLASVVKNGNAGFLSNYRFYYGRLESKKILRIKTPDSTHKEVTVKVTATGKSSPYTDTILLELIRDKWLVSKYWSTSIENLADTSIKPKSLRQSVSFAQALFVLGRFAYPTTIFTSLPLTAIILRTVLPAVAFFTLSRAKAFSCMAASSSPFSIMMRSTILPLT